MTLSFIAFHMRDYQRDTQQLTLEGHGAYFLLLQHCWTHGRIPLDDAGRAAICKVPVSRWRKQLASQVAGYFDGNGENKRATKEIEKAGKVSIRQAMAGHRGGKKKAERQRLRELIAEALPQDRHRNLNSGVINPAASHGLATATETLNENNDTPCETATETASHGLATATWNPSHGVAIKNKNITTTFSVAAREGTHGELAATVSQQRTGPPDTSPPSTLAEVRERWGYRS